MSTANARQIGFTSFGSRLDSMATRKDIRPRLARKPSRGFLLGARFPHLFYLGIRSWGSTDHQPCVHLQFDLGRRRTIASRAKRPAHGGQHRQPQIHPQFPSKRSTDRQPTARRRANRRRPIKTSRRHGVKRRKRPERNTRVSKWQRGREASVGSIPAGGVISVFSSTAFHADRTALSAHSTGEGNARKGGHPYERDQSANLKALSEVRLQTKSACPIRTWQGRPELRNSFRGDAAPVDKRWPNIRINSRGFATTPQKADNRRPGSEYKQVRSAAPGQRIASPIYCLSGRTLQTRRATRLLGIANQRQGQAAPIGCVRMARF
jgi:hypothetical protein